ncbi:MAG: glutathione S-transferase family protein [Magnetococcales bacterium]|nr:glutathione S-transferase family protein [Magnetococcales bacterium]
MHPELFLQDFCPYCQRVRIVLLHKNIPHQAIQIGPSNRPPWFAEVSPSGTVPALRDGALRIFDSSVITEYLNDISGGDMLPADPGQRAMCRSWINHSGNCQGLFSRLVLAADETEFSAVRVQLIDSLEKMEQGPLSREIPGLAGERLSLVDVAMAPLFTRLAHLETLQAVLPNMGLERVKGWSTRLLNDPAVLASIPENFPELFQRFLTAKAPRGFLLNRGGPD